MVVIASTKYVPTEALDVTCAVRQGDREDGVHKHRLNELEQANGLAIADRAVGQGQFNNQAGGRRAFA